jgi:hypothetical protein
MYSSTVCASQQEKQCIGCCLYQFTLLHTISTIAFLGLIHIHKYIGTYIAFIKCGTFGKVSVKVLKIRSLICNKSQEWKTLFHVPV